MLQDLPFTSAADGCAVSISPRLLAALGEHLAATVRSAREGGGAPSADLLDRLGELAMQLQGLGRHVGAAARLRAERLDLAQATLQARAEWLGAMQRRGFVFELEPRPIPLEINASVLKQAIDFGIGHALAIGRALRVRVGLDGTPPRPALEFIIERDPAIAAAARQDVAGDDGEELHAQLLALLARACGLGLRRARHGVSTVVVLTFPPPPSFGGSNGDDTALPSTPLPHGMRVLVVEPHEPTRELVVRLLRNGGAVVDAVATIGQARAEIEAEGVPHALVTGIAVRDPVAAALVDELREGSERLRIVELVDQAHSFDVAMPGRDAPARVARREAERFLVPALAQALNA